MVDPGFIHLRVHTAYSLSEGAIKLPKLIQLAGEHAMPAVAVTDTNNLFGALEFARGEAPAAWVSAKRFHHQYLPDEVQFEKDGLSAEVAAGLTAKGHTLVEQRRNYGNMHAVLWDTQTNSVEAASDPRAEGRAEVWR